MVLTLSVDDHINNKCNAPKEQCANILQGNIQSHLSGSDCSTVEPGTDTRTVTTDLAGRVVIMSHINDPDSPAVYGNLGFGLVDPFNSNNINIGYTYNPNGMIGLYPGPNSVSPGTPIQTSGGNLDDLEIIKGKVYASQQPISTIYSGLNNPVNTLLNTSPF